MSNAPATAPLLLLVACGLDSRGGAEIVDPSGITAMTAADDPDDPTITGDDDDDSGDGDHGDDGLKLDVGADGDSDAPPCAEGGCDDACAVPPHEPCDAGTSDLLQAIGLNCPGELEIGGTVAAAATAQGTRTGFGPTNTWAPREGSTFAVLGSGIVAELDDETPDFDPAAGPLHCNDDVGVQWDPGMALPEPLVASNVTGDCATSPELIGSGDCSNSIEEQYTQGVSANDYAELRLDVTVPAGSTSFSYDLAFFSVEYPYYYFSEFNDMYVGWLESEKWTGNISFDEQGNPISLNASFLDFKDDTGTLPEFAGTCMRSHGGTKWLSTTAPVTPGEDVTIVFAVFDLSDSILDSYVFLDNFQWGCEGTDQPMTEPVG